MLILPNPAGPSSEVDLDFVRLFHRAGDGYVTFHRLTRYFVDAKTAYVEGLTLEEVLKGEEDWEDLFAFRAEELYEMLKFLMSELQKNSHFSINGFRTAIEPDNVVGFWKPNRKLDEPPRNLWWLNAAWVDLDFLVEQRSIITQWSARFMPWWITGTSPCRP